MWKPQTRTRYKQRWNSAERKPWLRLSRAFDYVWDNAATTRKTRREKATRRNGGTKERRQREKERKAEAARRGENEGEGDIERQEGDLWVTSEKEREREREKDVIWLVHRDSTGKG